MLWPPVGCLCPRLVARESNRISHRDCGMKLVWMEICVSLPTLVRNSTVAPCTPTGNVRHPRRCNRSHRLEVDARKTDGATLYAPYEKQMIARVAETMTSEVDVRLSRLEGDAPVFEGRGQHACLEAQGDLSRVLGA